MMVSLSGQEWAGTTTRDPDAEDDVEEMWNQIIYLS